MRIRAARCAAIRRTARRALPVCLLIAVVVLPLAAEPYQGLKPTGYVNDFAHVLDSETTTKLTNLCTTIDQKAGAQIAVVTVNTLEGMEAPDYANRLFAQWGVGHKGDDRGVLVLLAVKDRKYWVEVGYGLEPILPDGKVGGFGREMVPYLKRGDFSGGVYLLTARIAGVIAADKGIPLDVQPPPEEPEYTAPPIPWWVFPLGIFLAVVVIRMFIRAAVAGGRRGGWRGPTYWGGFGGFGGGGFGGGGGGGGFGGFGGGMSGGGGAGGGW